MQTWLKEHQVPYPVAFDAKSQYFQGAVAKRFLNGDSSALLYPTMMLLGPDGKVSWAQTGYTPAKAIDLVVELEKRFASEQPVAQRAAQAAKILTTHVPELAVDANFSQALADDIQMRLTS